MGNFSYNHTKGEHDWQCHTLTHSTELRLYIKLFSELTVAYRLASVCVISQLSPWIGFLRTYLAAAKSGQELMVSRTTENVTSCAHTQPVSTYISLLSLQWFSQHESGDHAKEQGPFLLMATTYMNTQFSRMTLIIPMIVFWYNVISLDNLHPHTRRWVRWL